MKSIAELSMLALREPEVRLQNQAFPNPKEAEFGSGDGRHWLLGGGFGDSPVTLLAAHDDARHA